REQQKALFSNFTQANSKIAAVYGGTGLGLSLSQNLCRLMGGRIEIESELGKGSRFIIILPAQAGMVAPEPTTAQLPIMPRQVSADEAQMMAESEADLEQRQTGFAGMSGHSANHDRRPRLLVVDDDRNFLE